MTDLSGPDPIPLSGTTLSCAQVAAVAAGASVQLTPAGRNRAARSWRAANAAAARTAVYGRTTGVGANRNQQIHSDRPDEALALLRSHATSAGPLRDPGRVRALLAIRLNQLAAGGSGVAPAVLDALGAMLAADALPPVRECGSVGTGDLTALATAALTLAGELPATRPLPRAIELGPSDGLALISSNAATLADAALALTTLDETMGAAVSVAALSVVALRGNPEAFGETALRATPFPGARRVAARLRELLAGTDRSPARLQDPFALRTLPQVMGSALDALDRARSVTATMMNLAAENPLLLADGSVTHHGGFQASYLQAALDGAKLAVATAATCVLGRLGALTEPDLTGLPAFLGDGSPGASGVMACEYVAASALGDIRATAHPAGLQSLVLSRGVEEDASFASLAAVQLLRMADALPILLSCELVAAVRALRMRPDGCGGPVATLLECCAPLPAGVADRDLTDDLDTARSLLPALAGAVDGD